MSDDVPAMTEHAIDAAMSDVSAQAHGNENAQEVFRGVIRACLRELDEEREAVAHAADLERGNGRCLVSNAESLERLLPETEGEDD